MSSASWRVRIGTFLNHFLNAFNFKYYFNCLIALNLKHIDYEYKPINLIKENGEQYSDEFLKINPKQEVPALFIDNNLLVQSVI